MARFAVEERLVVTRSGGPSVVLKDMQVVAGHRFWKVAVADSTVGRILLDKVSTDRQLCRVSILSDLRKLRNAKIDELMSEPAAEGDLGLEEEDDDKVRRPLKRKRSQGIIPEFVTIAAPTIDEVSGMRMKVLALSGGKALWLEALPEVFEYLASVIAMQLGDLPESKPAAKKKAVAPAIASVGE